MQTDELARKIAMLPWRERHEIIKGLLHILSTEEYRDLIMQVSMLRNNENKEWMKHNANR